MKLTGKIKSFSELIGALAIIVSAIFGVRAYVDKRVEAKVNDPKFIHQLSKNIRPSLIFDANETIHADMGASAYIKSIEVKKTGDGVDHSIIVTITPYSHMPYPPIIESITSDLFEQTSKRGKGHEWICEMKWFGGGSDLPKFRLEVIK